MQSQLAIRRAACRLLCVALSISCALPLPALSAPLVLSTTPLATSTTTTVLPNLMFLFDSSGSMDWNYLPDWANDNLCKNTTAGAYDRACDSQPPFRSSDFNGVYYNPAIKYDPAINPDGTTKASQTTWTSVKNDAYNIQSTSSTNLVTSYVDVAWCTDSTHTDCLRNDNYILPGVVNGKSYTTSWTTTASGSGSVATGTLDAPTTATRNFGPHYYTINPGEYCNSIKMTDCQLTPTSTYNIPAKLRWCNSDANSKAATPAVNTCQALRTAGTYKYARYPTKFFTPASAGSPAVPAIPASATIAITMSGCSNSQQAGISSITVNGTNILPAATALQKTATNLVSAISGQTASGGYSFSGSSGANLVIKLPVADGNATRTVVFNRVASSHANCTFSPTTTAVNFTGYTPAIPAVPAGSANYPGSFVRTDIVTGQTYPRAAGRTDCTTSLSSCTYSEEMTNFANWWTYYQTRMQAMKTAVSRAFKPIDNRYRVGFIDLWGNNYLPIAKFDAGTGSVKEIWYNKLFSMNPANGTPLRSALARVGRIYAGKVGSSDPMQYSCQQNFTLLTTDGYWNTDADTDVKDIAGTGTVGNMDGGSTPRPMKEGPTAVSNSLADVAKYYYDTDLRTSALGNCTGSLGLDVCTDNVFVSNTDNNVKQHMTTFTLGLGVDGTLSYTSDYKTATTGDYPSIVAGTQNWPTPVADTETAVDDLWHAAVNGQGEYFSAKDPAQLASGLNRALSSIGSKLGAGAAAATSTLNPVAGDNFAYVASYTTVKWQGNLEARTINLSTGAVSEAASWCVENVVGGTCSAPGSVVADYSGGSTIYNCVTPGSTAATCGGVLDGANNCTVQLPVSCSGTMASKVGATTDSRTIYTSQAGALVDFTYANLTAAQKAYFNGTSLSQWTLFDAAQQANAAGDNMVKFLRGQKGFEDRSSNPAGNRLYRYREATLGDILESQPNYVGKPALQYTDPGYSQFITDNTGRAKTVFVGANDGMLHAFDAVTGVERWAFVPRVVMPNMWKLADKNYSTMHTNFVNGKPVIADFFDGSAWRTILVAGVNGGGRGYYALDVTNPITPVLLWELDPSMSATDSDLANLGYSFGPPIVTKKADGTWVVLLSSGYNNISPGDGKGYLFVRNILTGAKISTLPTGVGDTTTPSGLAKIATWKDDPNKNNLAGDSFGGDLFGNVWRFNINTSVVTKFAELRDSSGNLQAVTSTPELGLINKKHVLFIGTGKYLETTDLTTTQQQTLYAIKDDGTNNFVNPRASLVQQTITTSGATRTASSNPVDFSTGRGWYVNLPDSGERIHVDPLLDGGTIIAPSTVPSNAVCSPGGYGWLNYFNYKTGSNGLDIVSQKYNAPIVGFNVYYTPDGKRHVSVVTADDPTPTQPPNVIRSDNQASGFAGTRVIWREIIPSN